MNYIVQCLNITMDDIDMAQDQYMNEDQSAVFLDQTELERYKVPDWLTLEKARVIYDELKDYLRDELEALEFEGFTSLDE